LNSQAAVIDICCVLILLYADRLVEQNALPAESVLPCPHIITYFLIFFPH